MMMQLCPRLPLADSYPATTEGFDLLQPPAPKFSREIVLDGWKSGYDEDHREAVLFIHGYNSPTDWGCKVSDFRNK